MRYHFGPFTLDTDARELLDAGRPIDLEPQAFDVLTHLVDHRHRVVPKEELLDTVWGDRFVSAAALTTQVKQCRRVLGDDGETQGFIRTAHRVGYRFVAEVTVDEEQVTPAPPGGRRPVVAARWHPGRTKSLFGRESDLERLAGRVREHRLVTVTGPGGVGKTELASMLVDTAPDLVGLDQRYLCPLGATRTPRALANVVLGTLGEGEQVDADPTESVMRILHDREALVVLDCCEHLVHEAAHFVAELLRRCPGVRIVATSRRPLGVDGESQQMLAPLSLGDAITCFVARAADTGVDIAPDDPDVGELCRHLDGIPLALELAAARSRMLTPGEMLDLLDDRFRLLQSATTGERGTDEPDSERHASLYRTIAWSWADLEPEDQGLLGHLSVFVDSFSLDDVAAVGLPGADPFDVIEAVERLVTNSLVVATTGHDARTRFHLLDSIREFAAAQLDDPTGARLRHIAHFTELTERLDQLCQTPAIDEALAATAMAWPNLRAAVDYASEVGDTTSIRRIVAAVGGYADLYQLFEVATWCEEARLPERPTDPLEATVTAVWARMLAHRGERERARATATTAREAHENHATVLASVWCDYYDGALDRVVADAGRLAELSRGEVGMERGFADGFVAVSAAVRLDPALESTEIDVARADGGILGVFDCMVAGLQLCGADPLRASELLEAVVVASLRHEYRLLLGAAASTLTQITLPGRLPEEAARMLCRTLDRYRERGMWMLVSADTVMAAKLLADHGDVDTACRLIGARSSTGYRTGLSEALRTQLEQELIERIGSRRYGELTDQGARWDPPQAAAVAIDRLTATLLAGADDDPHRPVGDAQAGLRARKV